LHVFPYSFSGGRFAVCFPHETGFPAARWVASGMDGKKALWKCRKGFRLEKWGMACKQEGIETYLPDQAEK